MAKKTVAEVGTNIFNDLGARVTKIAAGLGQMLGNVVIIGRADRVEQQSARALSLVSIAQARIVSLINEQ